VWVGGGRVWSSFEGIVRAVKQRLCHWLAVIGRRYVPLNAAIDGREKETRHHGCNLEDR